MKRSSEQQAVWDAVLAGKSASAIACAGAGKSSTARPLCNQLITKGIPVTSIPFQKTLYAEELAAMPRADVLNAHARGKRLLPFGLQLDEYKVQKIAEGINPKQARDIADFVSKLKCENYGIDENVSAVDVAEKYGYNEDLITAATTALDMSDNQQAKIDYDDMLRFPVMRGTKTPVPFILIDEAQDYTALMRLFLALFIGPKTRGLISGDPERQALMQFAGGSPETYYKLAALLGCESIPLTYNFRCPVSVVDMANSYFPSDMKAAPGAIQGNVSECSMDDIDNNNESAVLCEMNSPLISYIITQVEQGKPVRFRPDKLWGKICAIMWGLFDTRKVPLGSIADRAEQNIQEYAGEQGPDPNKMEALKCLRLLETLAISLGYGAPNRKLKWVGGKPLHPIKEVLDYISKDDTGITCMTGHTAKGLQWKNVYHIAKEPAPRPGKVWQPWERHQWQCVGYVIRTRATENHYTIQL